MKIRLILIAVACLATSFAGVAQVSQNKHSKTTLYPSYKGLIMAGYQGWFPVSSDGVMYKEEARVHIDMWPDVSEYEKTYPTGLKLADGSTARFFSSTDKSTIDLHFKWMKDYGVDGVFMQRFFGETKPGNRSNGYKTTVLKNALEAASKYQRAIGVMYDLSGLKGSGEDCSTLIDDWKFLVDSLHATNQKGAHTYLFFNGKPLVTIWGIGFPDRPYNIRNIGIERFIDFLKNDPVYGGCSVMLGVPTFWRDLNSDCLNDPYLHTIIRSADLVMPWTVQRFSPLLHNDLDRYRDLVIADMDWCKANKVAYVPCVTPGFSWHNLSRSSFPDDVKPVASIPRQKGRFYWMQLATAINAGAGMVYVAMFDEVNEGTAIFKVTDNPPVGDIAKFADLEGMPSDHYLWLTGEASKALKNNQPLSLKIPQR
ncbi:hypothetical protein AGMMS50239_20340 [Bacteroidia bacterium]|nr:hypothetical protein AGMMS50239_20340 [Bacteroidia bacterium]